MTYEFVTTFSQSGYQCYGQAFVDSFVEQSDGHKLTIYHESQPNVDFHDLLTWRNLDHDGDRRRFIEDHGSDPAKIGSAMDPNSQSIRFCHKVFAITDAIKRHEAEWVIWVDADVQWTDKILDTHLQHACPHGTDLSFLGRTDMFYSECGWVGYRAAANPVQRLAEDMRSYYTTGEIYTRPKRDWHDSRCFDICRQRSDIPLARQHNLSVGVRGTHVWPNTVLDRFSRHNKGPRRKYDAYGKVVR